MQPLVQPAPFDLVGSSGNVAAASAVATLTAAAGKTAALAGFIVSGLGATAGVAVLATITGLLGGTITVPIGVPAGVTVPMGPFVWAPPGGVLLASGPNVNIVVTVPTFGAGNTNAGVEAFGFLLDR